MSITYVYPFPIIMGKNCIQNGKKIQIQQMEKACFNILYIHHLNGQECFNTQDIE
jgi:hypothetical protein